jgi:hypothetical protein
MPFESATRQKSTKLQSLVKPTGGGLTEMELPKTGLLARIWLSIRVTTAGTVTTVNAAGICSAIKRVKLTTNQGIDLFNVSGIGFYYMLQNALDLRVTGRQPKNQGNTAPVTATTYNLDMVIPQMINLKDPVGMLMLQSEQLQVKLSVDWESDVNVILTGGGTLTGTATPYLEFFTVPPAEEDRPPMNLLHQIIEDNMAVPNGADFIYNFPRGNVYLQALLGYGIKTTAVDNWTRAIIRINQNDIIYDLDAPFMDMRVGYLNNVSRGLGFIPIDLLGSDGLGDYGSARDFINSRLLTDYQLVLTPSAADTLYIIRRMFVPLER